MPDDRVVSVCCAGSGHHYQVSMNWTRERGHYVVVGVGRDADGAGQGAYFPGNGGPLRL